MAKKQKNISWTPIIITAMILIFLLIFGFCSNDYSYENSKSTNYNSNKPIEIDLIGSSQIKTINNPNQVVSIQLTGSSNKISVTKETQISLIKVVGSNNIFSLCKTHSPKINETGSGNLFNYLNC